MPPLDRVSAAGHVIRGGVRWGGVGAAVTSAIFKNYYAGFTFILSF